MAGHSKWANRVHRKTRQDSKRSATFAKISRQIMVAAREGGGNPDMNPRLRLAIAEGRSSEMPNDNIEYAIKRGTGDLEGVSYEQGQYDAFAPAGVALLISVLTDNKTRTVADVRNILKKANGTMGGVGTVTWMFDQKGVILVSKEGVDGDELFMAAVDAGADDVIDYTRENFIQSSQRYDVFFDLVGNHSLPACLRVLKPNGTYFEWKKRASYVCWLEIPRNF